MREQTIQRANNDNKADEIPRPYLLIFWIGAALLAFFLSAATAFAADYQPLVGLPGVTDRSGSGDLSDYINALFLISISLGALLAVLKIAIGGFKYMMTDVVTSKQDAKKDITGALLGLGILIAAVLVLTVINPNLVNLDVFANLKNVTLADVPDPGPQLGDTFAGRFCGAPEGSEDSDSFHDITDAAGIFTSKGDACANQDFVECMNETNGTGLTRSNLTGYGCEMPSAFDAAAESCRKEGGVYTNVTNKGYTCVKQEDSVTTQDWEVTDSTKLDFFRNKCEEDNCELIFVGEERDRAEQEETCTDRGGVLKTWAYNFQRYNYCSK